MSPADTNSKLLIHWFNNKNFYASNKINHQQTLLKQGQSNAMQLFRAAAARVPAYKDFLKKNRVRPGSIKTYADFTKLPVISKENYFSVYPPSDLSWNGKFSSNHTISTSSGTTGAPFFWPRTLQHEIEGAYPHELIFNQIFSVPRKNTLFVNGFPIGNWIAGTFTSACVSLYAWKTGRLTVMNPGYILETVLDTINSVSPGFEQTIIAGHSPFIKEVIDTAGNAGINWEKIHPKFLGTGQAVSEPWRNYVINQTHSPDYYRTFISLYGSADASLIGFETPFSIYLRRHIFSSGLQKQIFSDERIPSLCAFDPRLTFLESVNGEICVTKNSGAPLIRYNIHDEGGLLLQTQISEKLGDKFISAADHEHVSCEWGFPLVYLFGRAKFMTKIYGANIYTEHVQLVLDHQDLQPHITGRFILDTDYDELQNPRLICRVELNSNTSPNPELVNKIQTQFIETITKVSSEYAYVFSHMGERVKPHVFLHQHGDEKYFPSKKLKKTA